MLASDAPRHAPPLPANRLLGHKCVPARAWAARVVIPPEEPYNQRMLWPKEASFGKRARGQPEVPSRCRWKPRSCTLAIYTVIETAKGLSVVEVKNGETAATAASRHGGVVADPNLYRRIQDAYDALLHLAHDEQEDDLE